MGIAYQRDVRKECTVLFPFFQNLGCVGTAEVLDFIYMSSQRPASDGGVIMPVDVLTPRSAFQMTM